ncbi:hypothetical protein [Salinibacterium sp. SWN167]|uniref:hypothetical protein n=1 Tax=Salinibacterium sp. SWN167 TaxID=2792054 RepID=UPI0018CCB8A7|nr:hypothetical protein [Salinibacterium sp. SWN167]MBH0083179.1 hypothetical protein [Salinibacterium sp. SWN167]
MALSSLPSPHHHAPTCAPVVTADVPAWVAKAQSHSDHLLSLAGPVAHRAEVVGVLADDEADWTFGNFMLTWLDSSQEVRRIWHLPNAAFFLRLIEIAYAPVLDANPSYRTLLTDTSRIQMSITNDILQIQLDGLVDDYTMIRHHALMLFSSALWLDEPQRSQWLDLYDDLVTYVDSRPEGRPHVDSLAAVESAAFADFVTLAPQTLTAESADALLNDHEALAHVLDYQLYAGVAIGLLWREYRALDEAERDEWYRTQLSERYLDTDYLKTEWMAQ